MALYKERVTPEPKGETVENAIEYVCLICTEEFVAQPLMLSDVPRTLRCPCCGGTELELLGYDEVVHGFGHASLNFDAA